MAFSDLTSCNEWSRARNLLLGNQTFIYRPVYMLQVVKQGKWE